MERSSLDGLLQSTTDERPDFVLTLTDVSSSLRSRARRLITSVATLGLLRRTASQNDNLNTALENLTASLESNGFSALAVLSGPDAMDAGGGADDVLLLLRGTSHAPRHG